MTDLATARARCCEEIAKKLEPNPVRSRNVLTATDSGLWILVPKDDWEEHDYVDGDDDGLVFGPADFFECATAADDLARAVLTWRRDDGMYLVIEAEGAEPDGWDVTLRVPEETWENEKPMKSFSEALTLAVAAWLGIDTKDCLT